MQSHTIRNIAITLVFALSCMTTAQEPHVKEIPLPKEVTDLSYMKSRGDIRMKFSGDMKKAGEFYQAELTQKQWTKSTKDNLQKRFWVQTFTKQKLELQVRTENHESGCDIRLTPKGFLWDEDSTPRPEDIPIPENAQQLKYDDFFSNIEYQHDHSPRQLLDFYTSKLDSKVWQKSLAERASETSGFMERTSGIASISINVDVEGGRSKVKIRTKGMSWDRIKLANAKATKSTEATSSNSVGSYSAPKRVTKPNRAIDKLEKLPSIASVTVDGKKTPLTEIFAYELIEYGKWKTHIVATAQPVKQDALLKLLQANVPEEKWEDKWKIPPPYVKLILDDDDSLRSVVLIADKVPGSSTEVTGEAIVEAGRARGKAKLKLQKYFAHSYEAEIEFDTPLLSPTTPPRKLLEKAPKLENSGKITMAGKNYSLHYVLAYEEQKSNRPVIHVVMTEKPLDAAKILASLKQSGEVGMSTIGIQTQISFTLDENDKVNAMSLWCDGASVNWIGNDKIQSSVQSEGDRVRGTSKTIAKEDVFGKSFEFQASFDTVILRATNSK